MSLPREAYTAKAVATIHSAMDAKAAQAIQDGLDSGKYVIEYGNGGGYALLQEASTGVDLAYTWFPHAEGNPYGDVEVGDRLLEQIGM